MGFRFNYQPSAAAVAGIAYAGGYGQYEQGQQRIYEQRQSQQRSIAASLETQRRSIEAQRQSQANEQRHQQQMAQFTAANQQQRDMIAAGASREKLMFEGAQDMMNRGLDREDAAQENQWERDNFEWKMSKVAKDAQRKLDQKVKIVDEAHGRGELRDDQHEAARLYAQTEDDNIGQMPLERSELPRGMEAYRPWEAPNGSWHMVLPKAGGGYELQPLHEPKDGSTPHLSGTDWAEKQQELKKLEYDMTLGFVKQQLEVAKAQVDPLSGGKVEFDLDEAIKEAQRQVRPAMDTIYQSYDHSEGMTPEGEPGQSSLGEAGQAALMYLPEGTEPTYEAMTERVFAMAQFIKENGGLDAAPHTVQREYVVLRDAVAEYEKGARP